MDNLTAQLQHGLIDVAEFAILADSLGYCDAMDNRQPASQADDYATGYGLGLEDREALANDYDNDN